MLWKRVLQTPFVLLICSECKQEQSGIEFVYNHDPCIVTACTCHCGTILLVIKVFCIITLFTKSRVCLKNEYECITSLSLIG